MRQSNDPDVIYTEGDEPDPVTPEDPLEGIEVRVLKVWLANSPALRKTYKGTPKARLEVEKAVRLAVFRAHIESLTLRAQGKTWYEAEEITAPPMWTPPE